MSKSTVRIFLFLAFVPGIYCLLADPGPFAWIVALIALFAAALIAMLDELARLPAKEVARINAELDATDAGRSIDFVGKKRC